MLGEKLDDLRLGLHENGLSLVYNVNLFGSRLIVTNSSNQAILVDTWEIYSALGGTIYPTKNGTSYFF